MGGLIFILTVHLGCAKNCDLKGNNVNGRSLENGSGPADYRTFFKVFASADHIPIIGKGALLRTNASLKTRNDVCLL